MELPRVNVSTQIGGVRECAVDFLIVPVHEQDALADLNDVVDATGGDLRRSLESKEFRGKPFEIYTTRSDTPTPRVMAIGAGPRDRLTVDRLRKVAAAAGFAARQRGGRRIAWFLRDSTDVGSDARTIVDGLVCSALGVDRYKTLNRDTVELADVVLIAPAAGDLRNAIARGEVFGRCTNLARWLSDEPGNAMTPELLAEHARTSLEGSGVTVDVLDVDAMKSLNMGLLLGVGQGSAHPPRLIVMRYGQPAARGNPVLGLVGKGVTFDTGGISIKPADGMDKMKHDMSGGAAVIARDARHRRAQPSRSVIGVVPAVENMPDGTAFKPGDILRGAAGRTVEILNTDAEGRLILGDALWYAREQGATHLVDVATLTGPA